MNGTKKSFPIPDELHPHRKPTVKLAYTCAECGFVGDFMFCPYCGVRRPCPSRPESDG